MELLSKAAGEIRVERRKVRQLMDENSQLKDQLRHANGRRSTADRETKVHAIHKERDDALRQRDEAVEAADAQANELEALREQVAELRQRCREQQRQLQAGVPATANAYAHGHPVSATRQLSPAKRSEAPHWRRPGCEHAEAAPTGVHVATDRTASVAGIGCPCGRWF